MTYNTYNDTSFLNQICGIYQYKYLSDVLRWAVDKNTNTNTNTNINTHKNSYKYLSDILR